MTMPAQMTLILALTLAILSGCSKKEAPPRPVESRLQTLMNDLPYQRPCSIEIPEGRGLSWPVPTLIDGKLRYRAFFYGFSKPGPGADPRAPEGEALIAPEGKVVECRSLGEKRAPILKRGPESSMTVDEMLARHARLYAAIESAGALYASKLPLEPERRAALGALKKEFAALSEPAHAPYYRALNPDFWAWLDKNAAP